MVTKYHSYFHYGPYQELNLVIFTVCNTSVHIAKMLAAHADAMIPVHNRKRRLSEAKKHQLQRGICILLIFLF